MAQNGASGQVTREADGDVSKTASTAGQGRRGRVQQNSLADEAGRVSRQFGHVLHWRLDAYTGTVDEFGCFGNTVDSWRLQFHSRDAGLKAANAGSKGRR